MKLQGAETIEYEQEEVFFSNIPELKLQVRLLFLPVSLGQFDSLSYIHVNLSCMSI